MKITISRFENVILGSGKKLLDNRTFHASDEAFAYIKSRVAAFTNEHWQETLGNPFTTFSNRELVNFGDAIHDATITYEISVAWQQ